MGKIRICIPVKDGGFTAIKKKIEAANSHADIVELWADELNEEDLKKLIQLSKKPVLAVCRAKEERGNFKGTEKERIEMLIKSAKYGAEFIDVGIHTAPGLIRNLKKTCKDYRAKLIISFHDWIDTPSLMEMQKIVLRAKRLGADIAKIAVQINKWPDNVLIFELTKWARKNNIEIIAIGMGDLGHISRIGAPILGAYLTYVALDNKSKTAPGQLTIKEIAPFR